MVKDLRVTGTILRIVSHFLSHPSEAFSGADLYRDVGIGPGSLYPALARLEAAGWLSGEWETIDPSEEGRPRRRYYRITNAGRVRAREALSPLQVSSGELAWNT